MAPTSADSGGKRSRLGEILVQSGTITRAQLDHALAAQASFDLPIGETLLRLRYLTDQAMRQALGQQMNVPYLDLDNVVIDRELAAVIDRGFARRHVLMPVTQVGNVLTVAMDDPTASEVVADLARVTGATINVVTSSGQAIRGAFRRLYEEAPEPSPRPVTAGPAGAEPVGVEILLSLDWRDGVCTMPADSTAGAASVSRVLCAGIAIGVITDLVDALHHDRQPPASIGLRLSAHVAPDAPETLASLTIHVDVRGAVEPLAVRRALESARAKFSSAWAALPSGPALALSHAIHA